MEAPKPLSAGPLFLKKWLNRLRAFCQQMRIIPGADYSVHESAKGTQLVFHSVPGASAISAALTHAFKGIVRNFGTSAVPLWKRGVYFDSSIYISRSLDDDMALTGLLASGDPDDTDPGWKSTSPGDEVGVEVTFDLTSGDPLSATIKSTDFDGDWISGTEIEYDQQGSGTEEDPYTYPQRYGRRVCFTVIEDPAAAGNLIVQQAVHNDLYIGYTVATGYDASGTTPQIIFAGLLLQD